MRTMKRTVASLALMGALAVGAVATASQAGATHGPGTVSDGCTAYTKQVEKVGNTVQAVFVLTCQSAPVMGDFSIGGLLSRPGANSNKVNNCYNARSSIKSCSITVTLPDPAGVQTYTAAVVPLLSETHLSFPTPGPVGRVTALTCYQGMQCDTAHHVFRF
ncbi:hypothetical protein ACSMXN_04800 [Jatrophihabitans sp. DSM 45814]